MPTFAIRMVLLASLLALSFAAPLSTPPAFATPGSQGQGSAVPAGPSDIDRAVFVHYPRHAPPPGLDSARGGSKPGGGAGGACPDPATCPDYKWSGTRWTGPVSYLLDASGSGLPEATARDAVQASVLAWSSKASGLSVSGATGVTNCATAGAARNGINQICWADLTGSTPGAIAVTYVWYSRGTKIIVEADTVFNNGSGFTWSYTDPGPCSGYSDCNSAASTVPGTYDLRNIATHELGHFLALLGDLYSPQDAQLTMYGYGDTGQLGKDSLGKGDCLGIVAAYGGSC